MLSKGGVVDDYLKNPVLLYDHVRRGYENDNDIILPIGKVNSLRLKDDQWVGEPEFDQDDDFAKKVARKFDKGYLNAASIGVEILELSLEPELMVPGQTGPTITKWKLNEISITDIPANPDAVKLNYHGKSIALNGKSDPGTLQNFFNSNPNTQMKKVIALLNATGLVGSLPDTATEELVASGVQAITGAMSAKDQEIVALKKTINDMTLAATAEKERALKTNATALVDAALAAKKIVAAQKEAYITLASASETGYGEVKKIFEGLKPYEPVAAQMSVSSDEETDEQRATEYAKLHKEGKLEKLKASNPERFNVLQASFKNSKK